MVIALAYQIYISSLKSLCVFGFSQLLFFTTLQHFNISQCCGIASLIIT